MQHKICTFYLVRNKDIIVKRQGFFYLAMVISLITDAFENRCCKFMLREARAISVF